MVRRRVVGPHIVVRRRAVWRRVFRRRVACGASCVAASSDVVRRWQRPSSVVLHCVVRRPVVWCRVFWHLVYLVVRRRNVRGRVVRRRIVRRRVVVLPVVVAFVFSSLVLSGIIILLSLL